MGLAQPTLRTSSSVHPATETFVKNKLKEARGSWYSSLPPERPLTAMTPHHKPGPWGHRAPGPLHCSQGQTRRPEHGARGHASHFSLRPGCSITAPNRQGPSRLQPEQPLPEGLSETPSFHLTPRRTQEGERTCEVAASTACVGPRPCAPSRAPGPSVCRGHSHCRPGLSSSPSRTESLTREQHPRRRGTRPPTAVFSFNFANLEPRSPENYALGSRGLLARRRSRSLE